MNDLTIRINGKQTNVTASVSLEKLLQGQGIETASAEGIAVAINETIVRKPDWATRAIKPGDEIEIVTARQGG